MTLYQKIMAVVGMLRSLIDQRAAKTDLAPEFDPGSLYAKGRLVIYDGQLYVCTEDHSGAWDSDHFAVTTIDKELASKGEGGGGSPFADNLYVKDDMTGLFHKVTIESAGGIYTLAVDQEGYQPT